MKVIRYILDNSFNDICKDFKEYKEVVKKYHRASDNYIQVEDKTVKKIFAVPNMNSDTTSGCIEDFIFPVNTGNASPDEDVPFRLVSKRKYCIAFRQDGPCCCKNCEFYDSNVEYHGARSSLKNAKKEKRIFWKQKFSKTR